MRQAFGITRDNVPASDKVSTPLVWTSGFGWESSRTVQEINLIEMIGV